MADRRPSVLQLQQQRRGCWLEPDDSVDCLQTQPNADWQQGRSAQTERREDDSADDDVGDARWSADEWAEASQRVHSSDPPMLPSPLSPEAELPPCTTSSSSSSSSSSSTDHVAPHSAHRAYNEQTVQPSPHALAVVRARTGNSCFQYSAPVRGVSSRVERQVLEMLRSQPAMRATQSLLMVPSPSQVMTAETDRYLRLSAELMDAVTTWDLARCASLFNDDVELVVSTSLPSAELSRTHRGFDGFMQALSVLLSFVTITNISYTSMPVFCQRPDSSKIMQICTQRGRPHGVSGEFEFQQFNFLTWQHSTDRLALLEFYILDRNVADAIAQARQQQEPQQALVRQAAVQAVVASAALSPIAPANSGQHGRAAHVSAASGAVSAAALEAPLATCKLWLLLPACEQYLSRSASAAHGQRGVLAICSSCQLTVVSRRVPGSQTVFASFAVAAERLLLLRLLVPPAEGAMDQSLLQHELKLDEQGLHRHRDRSLRLHPAATQQLQLSPAPTVVLAVKRLTLEPKLYVYVMRSAEEARLAAAHFLHRAQRMRLVRLQCYAVLQPLSLKYQHSGQEIRVDTQQLHRLKSSSGSICRQL